MDNKINYFLTSVVILPTILAGIETCYSSIALPQMNLTIAQASWFAAGPGLAAAVGTLVCGSVLDTYGRKAPLVLSSFCHFIGWTIIYFDSDFVTVMCGRLFTGFPAPFASYAAQVYICECVAANDERLSDSLRTWPTVAFSLGQLVTFLLGALVTYTQLTAFSSILSLLLLVSMYFVVVESPDWLRQKGRTKDAEEASKKLGFSRPLLGAQVLEEEEATASGASSCRTYSKESSILKRLSDNNVYKPALIMMVVGILVMTTGGMALTSYMVNIIDGSQPGLVNATASTVVPVTPTAKNSITPNVSDPNSFKYSVISGALMLAGTISLTFVLPRVGARKVTIGSAICMCACMFLIGYSNDGKSAKDLLLVRLLSVWFVSFIFSFGILSVPFSILSAVFPLDAKGFGSLAIFMQVLAAFAVSATYPFVYLWSKSGIFYGYAVMCLLYAMFVYIFMPETVGRKYEQIRAEF